MIVVSRELPSSETICLIEEPREGQNPLRVLVFNKGQVPVYVVKLLGRLLEHV